MKIEVRPATPVDVAYMVEHMRKPDRDEAEALGLPHGLALWSTFNASETAMAGLADGELVTIFGVSPLNRLAGVGAPWLVSTPRIKRYAMPFARRNRPMVYDWVKRYRLLRNYVDARNTTAIRWLKWLGFRILAPVPHGPRGVLFHPFEIGGL